MRTSKRSPMARRVLAVGVALAAAAAGAVVATPAQAATAMSGIAGASADAQTSGGTCSSSGGVEASTSFSSNGQSHTKTASDDGTITNSGDMSDTGTWAATSKTTFKASQTSATSTLTMTSSLTASVNAALGSSSACDPEAEATSGAEVLLKVSRPSWVLVKASIPASGAFGIGLTPATDFMTPVQTEQYDQSSYNGKIWVDPGTYLLQLTGIGQADVDPGTPFRTSMSGTLKASAMVVPAGMATRPAAGSGRAYVSLPSGVGCLDGTVAVPFTAKASKAASATFYVNGRKKVTVKNPQPGVAALLTRLPSGSDTTVKVVVQPDKGKPATATRSYLACS